jgi:uncharacterized protein (TIGR02145 family)
MSGLCGQAFFILKTDFQQTIAQLKINSINLLLKNRLKILTMKAIEKMNLWKAIAFLTAVLFLASCQKYPPTVKTVSVKYEPNTTVILATGKVIAAGDQPVVSYGVCLSQNSNPTINDTKVEHHSVNYYSIAEFTDSFPNVNLNETYYLRAYAMSSEGVGYGEVISVATSSEPVIKNTEVNSITMTAATLSATLNPKNTNTENWFEYGIVGETPQKVAVNNSTGNSDAVISIKVSNLTPGKTYSFVAKAKNEYGETYSNPVIFDTYIAVDYDGNYYHGVVIGTQTWLKENLKTTHYLNGDPIPNLQDTTAWKTATTGAYVYYNHDPELGKTYGALYNWYVTSDPRGLISGFHTPSSHEFDVLAIFVGEMTSGVALMEVGNSHWFKPMGTDVYGFTALPNGDYCISKITNKVSFNDLGTFANFWCNNSFGQISEIAYIEPAYFRMLDTGTMFEKYIGFGLRLLKN